MTYYVEKRYMIKDERYIDHTKPLVVERWLVMQINKDKTKKVLETCISHAIANEWKKAYETIDELNGD